MIGEFVWGIFTNDGLCYSGYLDRRDKVPFIEFSKFDYTDDGVHVTTFRYLNNASHVSKRINEQYKIETIVKRLVVEYEDDLLQQQI